MNERQLTVCASALFCDGCDKFQVAKALDVDDERAQELIERGAAEQTNGTMGKMQNCPGEKGYVVSQRDDDGNVIKTVPRR